MQTPWKIGMFTCSNGATMLRKSNMTVERIYSKSIDDQRSVRIVLSRQSPLLPAYKHWLDWRGSGLFSPSRVWRDKFNLRPTELKRIVLASYNQLLPGVRSGCRFRWRNGRKNESTNESNVRQLLVVVVVVLLPRARVALWLDRVEGSPGQAVRLTYNRHSNSNSCRTVLVVKTICFYCIVRGKFPVVVVLIPHWT